MTPSGKIQIARPGTPSRQMTLSEVNLGLASGAVAPDDQYWAAGMSCWQRVKDLPGVVLVDGPASAPSPKDRPAAVAPVLSGRDLADSENLSFWAQRDTKPRIALWSPDTYTLLSLFFTPLLGTVLIAQNHRAADETVWRGIAWFWLAAWGAFLLALFSLHFAAAPCGPPLVWLLGFIALAAVWFFTCALPHRAFLHTRTFEVAWRTDWGKPVGFGFLAWVLIFTAFLLIHQTPRP